MLKAVRKVATKIPLLATGWPSTRFDFVFALLGSVFQSCVKYKPKDDFQMKLIE